MDNESLDDQHGRFEKVESLQAARAVAVLLVVICHASAFVGKDPSLWQQANVYIWLRGGALGVQLFFVISGAVIFRAHRNDSAQARRVGRFVWKRFRRIYPVYWIFLSLILLKHQSVIRQEGAYLYSSGSIVSNYLLIHLFSYRSIMPQAWTLFDEIQFYLVFAIWIWNRRFGNVVFGLWFGLSLLWIGSPNAYAATVFSPYHLLFGLGILLVLAEEFRRLVPAGVLFYSGMLIFVSAVVVEGPLQWGVAMRLFGGLGAACALSGAIRMEFDKRLKVPRWLIRLGEASYSIYIVHFMVISAIAHFIFAHLRVLSVSPAVWVVPLVLGGILGGIAIHYGVERPLLRMMGRRERVTS